MVSLDNYTEVKECDYKEEHYSVRDNGAVFRFSREGKRKRKDDNVWTFGKPNEANGYAYIGSERVHRIVAFAFLGNPPSPQHVVDHIDTNRQNNRPDNLRWVTKLENVLNNPITRARIENICGSIDVFLKNPSVLYGHEHVDPNFHWMRAVTAEEAKISRERLMEWAENRPAPRGGEIGDWVFSKRGDEVKQQTITSREEISSTCPIQQWNGFHESHNEPEETSEMPEVFSNEITSLTPNATQVDWRTPSEFPFCPKITSKHPLKDYFDSLVVGNNFCKNKLYSSVVQDFALVNKETSLVILTQSESSVKPWALAKVTCRDGVFVHENLGSFFSEEGGLKYFTLAKGEEWTGGNVFDDLC